MKLSSAGLLFLLLVLPACQAFGLLGLKLKGLIGLKKIGKKFKKFRGGFGGGFYGGSRYYGGYRSYGRGYHYGKREVKCCLNLDNRRGIFNFCPKIGCSCLQTGGVRSSNVEYQKRMLYPFPRMT